MVVVSQTLCLDTRTRTGADMSSSGRVLGNFTLAMCSQECLKRDAVTARRRRVFVNACSGSGRSYVVCHRRHVWMPVTCHGMSNCRFWCMCSPKNGCVRSSVHSGHDLVESFDIIVNNVCEEILSRHGDGAFLPIRVAAARVEWLLFRRRCVWTHAHARAQT